MSVYQHPSLTRLVEATTCEAGPSSTSLVVDHLLYQHTNARFRLARRELGMDPPQRIDEWVGENELEEEDTMESVLGYGNGRLGKKKGKGRAIDPDDPARAKPRRAPTDDWDDGQDPGRAENDERTKSEGIERMLAALLGKLSMVDGDESDEDELREAGGEEPIELDSPPSSAIPSRPTSPSQNALASSSSSLFTPNPTSTFDRPTSAILPSATRLRLLLSGLLDLLLSPALSPPPKHLPLPSAYNPTLPDSLRRINAILAPISSSPIPQLSASSSSPTSSSSVGAVVSAHPLLNHAHPSTSLSGQPIQYPRGSIWDQVPRAAGPEGPWAFAGGQVQASSRPEGFGVSSSANPPSMPSFPSSVEGPRTRKAVGRAKVLFDAGLMSATSVAFHQPRTRPPQAGTSGLPPSDSTRLGMSAGLEPAARKWWDIDAAEGAESVAGEGLGRMMGFLRLFLEVSRMVAEGVGKTTIETAEQRRKRSMVKHMFGVSGAAALWESDSEGSVELSDEDEARHRSRIMDATSSAIPTSSATFASSSSHSIPAPTPSYLYPSSQPPSRSPSPTPVPTPARRQPSLQSTTRTRQHYARPSRAWYALLSALLTQVCIEGFGEFGWKGGEAVELVLGVGKGGVKRKSRTGATPSSTLEDAGWGLFGSRAEGGKRRAEFEKEMEERCQEFLTVDSHTRSLRDHFSSLAAKYPLEPVERASIRFLEALSSFAGVPDLAQPSTPARAPATSSAAAAAAPGRLSISSLLNPHPHPFPTYQQQPPTPPADPRSLMRRKGVERWFVPPRVGSARTAAKGRGQKRGRQEEGSVGGAGAKMARTVEEEEDGGAEVPEDWPDSFGVVSGVRR